MVTSGKINFEEFVQTRPMSTIQESFEEAHKQSPDKRIVLVPDF
jgi:6-hydroxycyclohex-1-ene-1-carbonyl-CoA dehydrogenase